MVLLGAMASIYQIPHISKELYSVVGTLIVDSTIDIVTSILQLWKWDLKVQMICPRSLSLVNAKAGFWTQHCLVAKFTFLLLKKIKKEIRICTGKVEGPPKSATWVQESVFQHLLLFWSFVIAPMKSGKDLFIFEPMTFLYLSFDPPLTHPHIQ